MTNLERSILLPFVVAIFLSAIPCAAAHDLPSNVKPPILSQVSFTPQLDAQIPLDLAFRDENGQPVRLRDYARNKPLILTLVYYTCPVLCDQILHELAGGLRAVSFDAGKDFQVAAVSINPHETPADALPKQKDAAFRYHHRNGESGWHLLTGDQASIAALTDAAGFHYAYDPETKTYVHPSGILILTPDGRISRYLFGIEYAPRDLKLALLEASAGKIGTASDRVLLFCYQYNPANGKYGAAIARLMYWSALATVVAVAAMIILLARYGKRLNPAASGGMVK